MDNNNENVLTETITIPDVLPKPQHVCDKCGRGFDLAQALRMHQVRVHTRAGIQGAKKGAKAGGIAMHRTSEAQRAANRRMRLRNIARGLTSAGKPRKRPYYPRGKANIKIPYYRTPEAKQTYYQQQKARYRARGLNAQGKPFKRKQEPRKRFEQIVYPAPGETIETVAVERQIHYCPYCGKDIYKHVLNTAE